jgi:hypothetical protein
MEEDSRLVQVAPLLDDQQERIEGAVTNNRKDELVNLLSQNHSSAMFTHFTHPTRLQPADGLPLARNNQPKHLWRYLGWISQSSHASQTSHLANLEHDRRAFKLQLAF